ncbi:MAG TPA: hypothetical protein VND83_03840 [Acidimicrobiales bacterium]|nr:hypothetical protein [Acidimicrobiales bacterium]
MSRVGVVRRRCGRAAILVSAAVVFAACNSSPAGAPVIGHPSISIEVPLAMTACTGTGSCVALGTSASGTGPAIAAQYRRGDGTWAVLRTPPATSDTFVSSSCWRTGCLIAGTSPTSGDLIWRYRAGDPSLGAVTTPPLGTIATAVSCFGAQSCVLIDTTGPGADSRLSVTTNGGTSWSTPADITWSAGDDIFSIACTDPLNCVVAATPAGPPGGAPAPLVEVTNDGGITWNAPSIPANVLTMEALTCFAHHCNALVDVGGTTEWAHSRGFARRWTLHRLSGMAVAMACTPTDHCVIVGTLHDAPWLATTSGSTWSTKPLRYVPSALTAAACGTSVCAVSAPSTVATLAP